MTVVNQFGFVGSLWISVGLVVAIIVLVLIMAVVVGVALQVIVVVGMLKVVVLVIVAVMVVFIAVASHASLSITTSKRGTRRFHRRVEGSQCKIALPAQASVKKCVSLGALSRKCSTWPARESRHGADA
jgi:amino acid transporter